MLMTQSGARRPRLPYEFVHAPLQTANQNTRARNPRRIRNKEFNRSEKGATRHAPTNIKPCHETLPPRNPGTPTPKERLRILWGDLNLANVQRTCMKIVYPKMSRDPSEPKWLPKAHE